MNLAEQRGGSKGATLAMIALVTLAALGGCNRRDATQDAARSSGGNTANPGFTQQFPSSTAASAALPASAAASMPPAASATRP